MKVTREKVLGRILIQEMRSNEGLRRTRVITPERETMLPVSFGTLCKLLEATFAEGEYQLNETLREARYGDDW